MTSQANAYGWSLQINPAPILPNYYCACLKGNVTPELHNALVAMLHEDSRFLGAVKCPYNMVVFASSVLHMREALASELTQQLQARLQRGS